MSYSQLYYHIVIRPKHSQRVIVEANETVLYKYIWHKCQEIGCHLHRINGMPDHIHLLVEIPTTMSVADFVKDIKISSHLFIKNHRELFPDFTAWGRSYCALSYSKSELPKVKQYIINQKVHHAKYSYEDELRQIFEEFNIAYKEDFLLND